MAETKTKCPESELKFRTAIDMYAEAIALDLNNHVLISNRSAAFVQLRKYEEALSDAEKVVELKPDWAKGHYRRGVALHYLKRYVDAMVAFAKGLTLDSSNVQILSSLIKTALVSPTRDAFRPVLEHFHEVRASMNAFVATSVIGAQLLEESFYHESLAILLSARRIGTNNLKLKASLFFALGTAYWKVGHLEEAVDVMTMELAMVKSIGDLRSECLVLNSIGKCHRGMGKYRTALYYYKTQLRLADQLSDKALMAMAISNIGITHYNLEEYLLSLECHKKCIEYAKELDDATLTAEALGHAADCHAAMGNERDASTSFDSKWLAKQLALGDDDEKSSCGVNLRVHRDTDDVRVAPAARGKGAEPRLVRLSHSFEKLAIEMRALAGGLKPTQIEASLGLPPPPPTAAAKGSISSISPPPSTGSLGSTVTSPWQ